MDSYSDPTTLGEGVLALVENMILLKNIAYTREGWAKYNSSEMSSNSFVQGLGVYFTNPSTPLILAVVDGKLFSGSGGTMTQRYSGLSTSAYCQIVQFRDVALVIDGDSGILVYEYGETPYIAGVPSPNSYEVLGSFQDTETWSVTNGTQTANEGYVIYGSQSILFLTNAGATMTFHKTLSSAKDLTEFPDGSTATSNDYIRVQFLRGDPSNFTSCTLKLGNEAMTDYFYVTLSSLTEWTGVTIPYYNFDIRIHKSSFSSTGSPNWNAIDAVEVVIVASGATQAAMTMGLLTHHKAPPTVADSGSGGNPSGTYYYGVTFLTADDEESELSLLSDAVTVTTNSINVTNIPISGSSRVLKRKLYRLGGTSDEWKLVTQFYENTTTSYLDDIADTDLGDAFLDVSGEPQTPKCMAIHDNFVIIANLTSSDGIESPSGVMVSNEYSYEVYDPLNTFDIEPHSGAEIKWLISEFGYVWVGKFDSIWYFNPANLDIPPVCATRAWGGVGKNAVCNGENCFFFLDKKGVVMSTGSSFEEISTPFVRNYIDQIPEDTFDKVWMQCYDHILYIGIPITYENENIVDGSGNLVVDGSSNQVIAAYEVIPNVILCFNVRERKWYKFSGWHTSCALTSSAASFGRHLYLGNGGSGYIYEAFSGDDDDGTDITSTLTFKDDDYGKPETRKDFYKIFLCGYKLVGDAQLTITPVLDLVESSNTIADTTSKLTSLISETKEIPMPEMGGMGTYLGLKITATSRWAFRSLIQVIRLGEETI